MLKEQNDMLTESQLAGEAGQREEAEKWKIKCYEVERQKDEITTEFEKEKALWLGKHEFQEKQQKQLKLDLEDNHKMFQDYIANNQKDRDDQKSKTVNQHQAQMMQME